MLNGIKLFFILKPSLRCLDLLVSGSRELLQRCPSAESRGLFRAPERGGAGQGGLPTPPAQRLLGHRPLETTWLFLNKRVRNSGSVPVSAQVPLKQQPRGSTSNAGTASAFRARSGSRCCVLGWRLLRPKGRPPCPGAGAGWSLCPGPAPAFEPQHLSWNKPQGPGQLPPTRSRPSVPRVPAPGPARRTPCRQETRGTASPRLGLVRFQGRGINAVAISQMPCKHTEN